MKKVILPLILLIQSSLFSQDTTQYEVYAIQFGKPFFIKMSYAVVGGSETDSIEGCNMFWLLKGNKKNILVDAGFISNDKGYIRPDSALFALNIKPEDITDIIITHPHYDHIGGVELFPNAQNWIQKDDYDYFVGRAWQKGNFHDGFNKKDVKTLVDKNLEGKLTFIKGDSIEIFPGIRVFIGSKHTWESQYVLVNTKKERVIIASDNSWFYYNLIHLVAIPTYTFDPADYVNELKRMRILQPNINFIIPGHDTRIFSMFPKVSKNIVQIQ